MLKKSILEVCTNSIQSTINAVKAGAKRVELCSNLEQGGTTPSAGMILVTTKLDIDIFVLIRPRTGDFLYTETEYETIKSDVIFCKENGCEGVVVGFLTKEGTVDKKRTQEIVALAKPMEVTFHRAFDCVENPQEALEKIISSGCTRLLTSGLAAKAIDGKEQLRELVQQANRRIYIMAGSGINEDNISELYEAGIREFHASASSTIFKSNLALTPVATSFYTPNKETQSSKVERLLSILEKLDDEN
jgi:copper homeostasis protein